jgi:hypothetical protein
MKWFWGLFFTLFSFQAISAELILTGGVDYNQTNLFGQNESPTYRGSGQWAEVDYLLPIGGVNAVSVFAHYHQSKQENTFTESLIKEKLTLSYFGVGLKYWSGKTFFSTSYGKIRFRDDVTGDVNRVIETSENGLEFGVGYRLRLGRAAGLIFSLNANYAKLKLLDNNDIPQKLNFWNYRAAVGLSFVIPSNLKPPSTARYQNL